MVRILAFDIGIKNLAWCCLEKEGETFKILGWDNYNLLSESSNAAPSKKQTCHQCSAKGLYDLSGGLWSCVRHCPQTKPALRDMSGNVLKKLPKVEVCRSLLTSRGLAKVPTKKQQVLESLQQLYSLPSMEKKVSKAPDVGLTEIHDSLRSLVQKQAILWGSCTEILLENQPAFKNPTMKSVQILLFATLRDCIPNPPPLRLVHAGKKVAGATKGDAGYKERKSGSEARAAAFLSSKDLTEGAPWKTLYEKAGKKSDLADALAMCIDATA
jgi:hypothetical protein